MFRIRNLIRAFQKTRRDSSSGLTAREIFEGRTASGMSLSESREALLRDVLWSLQEKSRGHELIDLLNSRGILTTYQLADLDEGEWRALLSAAMNLERG
jgi:hypothetical protein